MLSASSPTVLLCAMRARTRGEYQHERGDRSRCAETRTPTVLPVTSCSMKMSVALFPSTVLALAESVRAMDAPALLTTTVSLFALSLSLMYPVPAVLKKTWSWEALFVRAMKVPAWLNTTPSSLALKATSMYCETLLNCTALPAE